MTQTDPAFRTMCPMNCHPTLCGMKVTRHGPQSVTIAGDPDHPDSAGYLCMRGNAAHEIVGNPARRLHPMERETPGKGDWRRTGWETALDRIAGAMRRAGPGAVGFWQGHGNAANDYGVGLKKGQMQRFANLYGAQHWDGAMICWGLGGFGLGLTGALEASTKEDMGDNAAMILLWGANTVSQANTFRHVERAKRRGARIVVIDIRRTEAGALVDEVVLIRPGTDTALALGMMHVIVAEGLWNREFVAAHTDGFDALAAHLGQFTPDWAEGETGVPADTIAALARDYARTRPAMIVLGGSSMHKGANGWRAARAISCLPALVGDYGVPGGGMGPRHGARSHGAGFADITARDRRPPGAYIPNQMQAIVEALEDRRIRVLVTIGANILSSFPDTARLRAALAKADLVVAYDIFESAFMRETAHIFLPGTIWLEEIGAKATNTHVYLSDKVLDPAGEARPATAIYRGLASRLGVEDVYPWHDQEAALDAVLDHPGTGHATVWEMRQNGGRAALQISHVAYPARVFDTPSGRIEFRSGRAAAMGLPAVPEPPDSARPGAAPLRLAQGRTFAQFHSFYDSGRALPSLAAREPVPSVWIAPSDAAERGIADGDPVVLSNAQGHFDALAKVTPRIPARTLWMRDGWPGFNTLSTGRSVLPEAALDTFAFSVGQSEYTMEVELSRR